MSREIDGVLLIDKPEGITSAHAVRILKRKLNAKKIGHGGTLDPMATGLLVILLGRATKLSSAFLDGEKSYSGRIRLGRSTDTDDVTGQTLETDGAVEQKFPENERSKHAAAIVRAFFGRTSQVPPAFSALKVDGKRSYDLAREGRAVELAPREIVISELSVGFVSASELEYFVRCSKGTYIRALARDIGAKLGTYGCLQTIRRESSGSFEVGAACALDALEAENLEQHLIPIDRMKGLISDEFSASRAAARSGDENHGE